MQSDWNFNTNILYNNNKPFVVLPSEIKKILVLENSIVVLLNHNQVVGNRNVFAYDFNKKIQWQIPAPVEFHSDNEFSAIYLRENELYAYNINGVEYHLNKDTGEILESQLIK
jgi:hypothetical protein